MCSNKRNSNQSAPQGTDKAKNNRGKTRDLFVVDILVLFKKAFVSLNKSVKGSFRLSIAK